MDNWHLQVAEIDGVLHVHSHCRNQRSVAFVIEQLERLKQFLRQPPRNPIVPEIWQRARAFKPKG